MAWLDVLYQRYQTYYTEVKSHEPPAETPLLAVSLRFGYWTGRRPGQLRFYGSTSYVVPCKTERRS